MSGLEQGHSGLDKGPSTTEQPLSASDKGMSGPEEPLSALEKPLPGPDKVVSLLQSPFPPRTKLCPRWKRAGPKRRAICPSRTKPRRQHLRPPTALMNTLSSSATPFQTSPGFHLDFCDKRHRAYCGTRNAERGTRNAERGTRNAERGTRNAERGTRRRKGAPGALCAVINQPGGTTVIGTDGNERCRERQGKFTKSSGAVERDLRARFFGEAQAFHPRNVPGGHVPPALCAFIQ